MVAEEMLNPVGHGHLFGQGFCFGAESEEDNSSFLLLEEKVEKSISKTLSFVDLAARHSVVTVVRDSFFYSKSSQQ